MLLKREQHYIDLLCPELNINKIAGSMLGFKHSKLTRERLSKANMIRVVSEETKKKLHANTQALKIKVENLWSKEIIILPSIRRGAEHIKANHSYIAACLNKKGFYKYKGYYITKVVNS